MTAARKWFYLGYIDRGYDFTDVNLRSFPTLPAALAAAHARGLYGPGRIIVEQKEVKRNGGVYGINVTIRSPIDGKVLRR